MGEHSTQCDTGGPSTVGHPKESPEQSWALSGR